MQKPQKTHKLILVGTSSFAEVAYEYFKHDSCYDVVAFSVEKEFITQKTLFNLPIIPFEDLETKYSPGEYSVFVAIASNSLNRVRTRLYNETKKKQYKIISYINSKAQVWPDVKIGENCFIFEHNVIQPFVEIGNNVILWSGNHVGHHSKILDNCFVSSHVVISGHVTIEENCFIGVNVTIRDNVVIAKDCFLDAGSVILKDTLPEKFYRTDGRGKPSEVNTLKYFGVKPRRCHP